MVAIVFWFGIERLISKPEKPMTKHKASGKVLLRTRIEHMLTEARVLLPGAQAMLGFQFAVMLTRPFDQLPDSSKFVHFAALALIAVVIVLLMTPAAIHRLTYGGDETQAFDRIGARFVVIAALPLGLGIGADMYVAVTRGTGSSAIGIAGSAATILLLAALWFIQPLVLRARGS